MAEQLHPVQYGPTFWPGLVAVMVDVIILIALASWAFSQAKKAWRGEEVKLPLSGGGQ